MNKTIKLSPFLKDWIVIKANEQNLAVNELIEKPINFYIEKNNITTSEVMDNFFKLPKSIRKIIATLFLELEEKKLEKIDFDYYDFYPKLFSIMSGYSNIKFYSDGEKIFTDFLKEHDVFNTEI